MDIVQRFGDIRVYSEPFGGSFAVLLASPKRDREIACDKDGMVVNAWRAIQNAPDAVAYWADYPTFHDDLTARRHWLADWRDTNRERLTRDPLYYDPQAAGWWIYCVSSWIGGAGQMLERSTNQRPHVGDKPGGGGQGVSAQRLFSSTKAPYPVGLAADKRPYVVDRVGGQGISDQRTFSHAKAPHRAGLAFDKRPLIHHKGGGIGVQASRKDLARKRQGQELAADKRPHVDPTGGGQGVQAGRSDLAVNAIPAAGIATGSKGVQAQRRALASHQCNKQSGQGVQVQRTDLHDQRPFSLNHPGGQGVQVQRTDLTSAQMPKVSSKSGGKGVQAQRKDLHDKRPKVANKRGGNLVQAQSLQVTGRIGTGERLSDWMYALADRLAGVVILNRDWSSAVTPTLLQHTPTSPKPPVGVFLDPPYLEESRSADLYSGDGRDENPAEAAYRWAVEHGAERYRIAYACHEGDFPVPDGWTAITRTFGGIKDKNRSGNRDMIMFSPTCLLEPQQSKLF